MTTSHLQEASYGTRLYSDAPLSSELLHFTNVVDSLGTPEKVWEALHKAVTVPAISPCWRQFCFR